MYNRIAVIGIGSFGKYLVSSLSEKNISIIAIDKNEDEIDKVKNFVDKALIMDITNEEIFDEINWNEIEIAIVALGDNNLGESVTAVALLKQANIARIIARTSSELHSRILKNIGATEIINPEKDIAELLVNKLAMPNIIHMRYMDNNNVISEFIPPASFIGKSIISLDLRKRFNISIIAIRRIEKGALHKQDLITNPKPSEIIQNEDILIGIGNSKDFEELNRLG
ncbi:MAG: TrkA family potassium uptake protein [Candidatus Delongbacteria bacterium]|jgi:trk system potassium uptake protein TrkA|nr:TrkA family potassium uptake protein [Candidatus Delongbacteria bacterium]